MANLVELMSFTLQPIKYFAQLHVLALLINLTIPSLIKLVWLQVLQVLKTFNNVI